MNYVYFDNYILTRIAWTSEKSDLDGLKSRWDLFVGAIHKQVPNLLENNFEWIETDLLFLEIIGLGKVKEKKNKNIVFLHQPLKDLFQREEWIKFYPDEEKFIKHIVDKIDNYIATYLNPRNLYRQALSFEKKFICHEASHFIFARIKQWRKKIRKEAFYGQFRGNFSWNALSNYPFISTTKKLNEDPGKFWARILGVLFRYYYEIYKNIPYFEGSLLGVCSELHRTGKFYHDASSKSILKLWSDMVDTESIHYALLGKKKISGANDPVVVITGDSKSDVECRLESMYKNLIEINEKFELSIEYLKIDLCPGIIICVKFDGSSWQNIGCLKVQDYIQKWKSN